MILDTICCWEGLSVCFDLRDRPLVIECTDRLKGCAKDVDQPHQSVIRHRLNLNLFDIFFNNISKVMDKYAYFVYEVYVVDVATSNSE